MVTTVVALLGVGCVTLLRAAVGESQRLWADRSALRFDDLVVAVALAVLAVVGAWLCLALTLTVLTRGARHTHTLAGRLARRITPSLCRTLLGGACGAAVLVAPTGAPAVSGLPLPDRPVTTPGAQATAVRVRHGDTLWAIAARELPRPATDAHIARAWPAWFETNRARIGPDPHLIHPGTRLVVPRRFR